ncbi:MAG: glycosyltransferase, partial [Candidatus Krumholzibacteria bacterium]|nr:glycosyltransferase [Candidatus Krumholzibacteria bacterium]
MRVLLVSMSLKGGAGGSAYRLHRGLRQMGIESRVLVKYRYQTDDDVVIVRDTRLVRMLRRLGWLVRQDLENLPLALYQNRDPAKLFSTQWVPDGVARMVAGYNPDIVNLRWVGNLLRIESLRRLRRPLVWTLSDMWPFTGGCYIPQECDRYQQSCGACPHLNSRRENDLSRWVWRRKSKAWRNLDLTIVTPSQWLARCARSSALFKDRRIEVIPSAVDTENYKPIDRTTARRVLGLPQDKKIALFVAWRNHVHKGFHLLVPALKSLAESGWKGKLELVVLGFPRPADLPDTGIETRFLGRLDDTISKSIVYSAADVFVAPSTQDNFANTVLEAIACGTPTVAFTIGGMPDILDHQGNGYLARDFDIDDLARGIDWVLTDSNRHER